MKKIKLLIIAATVLPFLVSCDSKGNKFVGIWTDVKDIKDSLIIKESGKNYLVTSKGYNKVFGGGTQTIPASYDEAHDKLTIGVALGSVDLTIDDKTKHLFFFTSEYKKNDN